MREDVVVVAGGGGGRPATAGAGGGGGGADFLGPVNQAKTIVVIFRRKMMEKLDWIF
jgi:hypothetical protein